METVLELLCNMKNWALNEKLSKCVKSNLYKQFLKTILKTQFETTINKSDSYMHILLLFDLFLSK